MTVFPRLPSRGEIWWSHMPTDPPGKGKRPVLIVSLDQRNHHPRSNSVLVIPLSTSIQRVSPSHLLLQMGETGLNADSIAQAENITTLPRDWLSEPRPGQRTLTNTRICQLSRLVHVGMACSP
jgi:mRNA-degrading endonuclease toxin of MazEF toxin-antitoxin module